MPWKVQKAGNKYQVVKADGSGKVVGTHDTEAAARSQMKLLYAKTEGESK